MTLALASVPTTTLAADAEPKGKPGLSAAL